MPLDYLILCNNNKKFNEENDINTSPSFVCPATEIVSLPHVVAKHQGYIALELILIISSSIADYLLED